MLARIRRRDLEPRGRDRIRTELRGRLIPCSGFRRPTCSRSPKRTRPTMKPTISFPNFFLMAIISSSSCTAEMTRAFTWARSTPRSTTWFCAKLGSGVCGTWISAIWAKRSADGSAIRCQASTNFRSSRFGLWTLWNQRVEVVIPSLFRAMVCWFIGREGDSTRRNWYGTGGMGRDWVRLGRWDRFANPASLPTGVRWPWTVSNQQTISLCG